MLIVLILLERDKEIKLLSRNYLNIFNYCTLQSLILSSISILFPPVKQLLYSLSMHDKYWEFHLFFRKEEDEVILHLLYSCPWAVKQLLYNLSVNVYYVMGFRPFRPNYFTCTAHLYLYCTLLVPHTYASYIRHWCIFSH